MTSTSRRWTCRGQHSGWRTASRSTPAQVKQYEPRIASDGAGGAIVAWKDYIPLNDSDIYRGR